MFAYALVSVLLVTQVSSDSTLQALSPGAAVDGPVHVRRFRLAGGTGFPGLLGVYGSFFAYDWLSAEVAVDSGFGTAFTGGVAVHVPLLRHGAGKQHRHGVVGLGRLGWLVDGSTIMPPQGPYRSFEVGYGYRGKTLDTRLLVGVHGAQWRDGHHDRWESKPMFSLQIGRLFG